MNTIVTFHSLPAIDCGQFDIADDGVYIEGALVDKAFMESAGFYLVCENVAQAQQVRNLIENA
jgi:hypothetical protein